VRVFASTKQNCHPERSDRFAKRNGAKSKDPVIAWVRMDAEGNFLDGVEGGSENALTSQWQNSRNKGSFDRVVLRCAQDNSLRKTSHKA